MLKLGSTWHIPDTELPEAIDRHYFDTHIPAVRRLPGLRRHVVLKAIPVVSNMAQEPLGGFSQHLRFWRGEDFWFDSREDFDTAVHAQEWKVIAADGFYSTVAGLQFDLFDIVEEYRTPDTPKPADVVPGKYVIDRGLWRIPDEHQPEAIDRHYFDIHVPIVRRLPSIRRHVLLKGASWPAGRHPRIWRGADCWKDTAELQNDKQFEVDDGYAALLAGLEFDRFAIEEEWTPEQ